MIKRLGHRIELDEIETCLYRHPAIASAAAVAVHHPKLGVRIVACLAGHESIRPSIIGMKTLCNNHFPAYMNPDVFIFVNFLPRTPTNKVDYQNLVLRFQTVDQLPGSGNTLG